MRGEERENEKGQREIERERERAREEPAEPFLSLVSKSNNDQVKLNRATPSNLFENTEKRFNIRLHILKSLHGSEVALALHEHPPPVRFSALTNFLTQTF